MNYTQLSPTFYLLYFNLLELCTFDSSTSPLNTFKSVTVLVFYQSRFTINQYLLTQNNLETNSRITFAGFRQLSQLTQLHSTYHNTINLNSYNRNRIAKQNHRVITIVSV